MRRTAGGYTRLARKITFVIIVLALDITRTQCSRSCASCRESFAHCSKSTGVCKSNCRRTKLCKRSNDLCLATWRWKNNRVVMFTSCFRLPPFSNSSQYNSKCQATVLNETRTCLCQGTGCNRKPTERVKEDWKQALSSENPMLLRQKRNVTQNSSRTEEKEPKNVMPADKQSNRASTIVWISLAAVLFPLLIAGLIIRLRRCRNDHLETKMFEVFQDSVTSEFNSDHERINQDAELNKFVALETILSRGRYATVWKGREMGQHVAVKIFQRTSISAWQKECHIYEHLSVGHSNITKLRTLRETRDDDPLCFIMEYCENGSLREYLKKKVLSWSEAAVLASGITSAVAFLHSENVQTGGMKVAVAHRDLKSTNVLVRKDGTSVISDFGLAVLLNSVEDESKNIQVGTYRYMSPEELLATVDLGSTEAFKQMDIYSMALVLWEIISRCEVSDTRLDEYQPPFADMVGTDVTLNNMIEVAALKQCRPSLPGTRHEGLKLICQTVQECWDPDPEARLTADCTQLRLKELLTKRSDLPDGSIFGV